MKEHLSGGSIGAALGFGMFGDPFMAVLSLSLAVAAFCLAVSESIREQD